MDAEFVEFLDEKFLAMDEKFLAMDGKFLAMDGKFLAMEQKFQVVSLEIQGVRGDLKAFEERVNERLDHLETAVESLTRSVDRMLKIYEQVATEQKVITADIARIKTVLREKLGVQL